MKYCFIDFETGGLTVDRSPLQIGIAITDEHYNILQSYEYYILTDPIIIDSKALEVNNIDMKDVLALGRNNNDLDEMLVRLWPKKNLIMAGWNVPFDRGFLTEYFPLINNLLARRTMDIMAVAEFHGFGGSLQSVAKTLLGEREVAHKAMADVETTILIAKYLKEHTQWTA